MFKMFEAQMLKIPIPKNYQVVKKAGFAQSRNTFRCDGSCLFRSSFLFM